VITADQLRAIMPGAKSRADQFEAPLNDAMAAYGIDTPARQAAFLAQIAHESGQLRYTRELWGPTPTQLGYEGRADLGNTQPGDGARFKGRGLIQITGRANYAACGAALGLPLLDQPELLEQPDGACKSAAWFWKTNGLNELADVGEKAQIAICRRINGGTNGLADRQAFWERARAALGA